MKTLRLPIPPSVNQAYGNNRSGRGRGRYKTSAYKAWERHADIDFTVQREFRGKLTNGPAKIVLRLPQHMRGDIDNRIKPLLDWLASRELTDDDSTHQEVRAQRDPALGRVAYCEVDIEDAE